MTCAGTRNKRRNAIDSPSAKAGEDVSSRPQICEIQIINTTRGRLRNGILTSSQDACRVREKVSSFKRHKDPNRTDPDETELTEALNGPIKHKALQLNLNSVIMKLSTTLALFLLNSPLASGEAGGIRSAVTSAESDTAGQNTDCHCSAGHCDQRACGQFASCGGKPAGLDLLSFIRFQLLTFTSLHPSVE